MSRYYQIPKTKRNPRIIHLYDIPAIILIVAIATALMPIGVTLDLSTGFNEKSQGYMQAERQLLLSKYEECSTYRATFEDLFNTSCLQNGGYIYDVVGGPYRYQDGSMGVGYYAPGGEDGELRRPMENEADQPRGLICSGVNLSLTEDGQVYFSDLEEYGDLIDAWVDVQAEPDLARATGMILKEDIPLPEAAELWSLIERGILIGFDGHNVWFRTESDGVHSIHRGNAEGVETIHSIKGDAQNVMVIESNYLIYALNGDLYIRCLKTGEENHIACTNMEGLGAVRQIAYRVHVYGAIRIYTLNENEGIYFDLSETGAQTGELTKMTGLDFNSFSGLDVTGTKDTIYLWFRGADGYTCVKREG